MDDLLEKIRKARQTEITIGDKIFLIRRPTEEEALELFSREGQLRGDKLANLILGWKGLKIGDLPNLETDEARDEIAEFSPERCREWLADNVNHWQTLIEPMMKLFRKHMEARNASPKP